MESKINRGQSEQFHRLDRSADGSFGLAACDLTTGELYVTSFHAAAGYADDEVNVYHPVGNRRRS